ncbi:hypothetical protein LINPERHAP1_LOCUS16759, partial [Linum perenne]
MPVTYHGLCTFHILNNAARNLGSLCDKVFVAELSYLMFGVDTEAEFDVHWGLMKKKCFPDREPEGHPWLTQIYQKR